MTKIVAIVSIITLAVSLLTCKRHTFVTTKLTSEKISENCQNLKPALRSEENIAGRRFEFERCLPAGFQERDATIERNSDTVMVKFPKHGGSQVFKITLDIDSYPEYHFLSIDDEVFLIAGKSN